VIISINPIDEYFERPDTPAANSPVGVLMVKIIGKNPGITFEGARAEANRLLDKAARAKVYRFPQVLSPEEQAETKARLQEVFKKAA
jgi:hypothetical protein